MGQATTFPLYSSNLTCLSSPFFPLFLLSHASLLLSLRDNNALYNVPLKDTHSYHTLLDLL